MLSGLLRLGVVALAVRTIKSTALTTDEPSDDTFGRYLRRELQTRGWSVRYLALRSGVNHSTISRLLHGRSPKLETLRRLQEVLLSQTAKAAMETATEDWLTDPVKGVAAALARDPMLDARRADEVLRYYLALRASEAPTYQQGRMPPAASIRRVRERPPG